MVARKKKKCYLGKSALIISSIAFLNFVGVSYAHWNDQLRIRTTVTTGEMDVRFSNGQKGMVYDAEIMLDEEIIIPYSISNRSTIPIEFSNYQINGVKQFIDEEYADNRDGISFTGKNGEIKVTPTKPGIYKFNVVLNYKQRNE